MYVFFKQNYCKGIVIFFILFIFFSCDLFGPGPTPPPTAEESPTPTPKSSVTLSPLLTPPETSCEFPYSPYEYPIGISSVSIDQEADNAFLANMCEEYDLWKQSFVTADGAMGCLRVKNPEGSPQDCTESEGIGYGMLLAVYMDDPHLFENLWCYSQYNLDGNGLMNREVDRNGLITESGSNTVADIDIASALVFATKKWGNAYKNYATDLINNIFNHDVCHSGQPDREYLALKSSDTSGVQKYWSNTNPFILTASFKPAYMRIFGAFTGNVTWEIIASRCYDILETAANNDTGLIPDWCGIDGTPGGNPLYPLEQENFYYDAARVPYNIGLDYLWSGEMRAHAFCDKISRFFDTQRDAQDRIKIWNGYTLDASEIIGVGEDTSFTGCAGVGALAAGNLDLAREALEYTKDFKMNMFYQDTIRLLTTLVLTGNYNNLYAVCSDSIPTPAPTAVRPDPCPTGTPPEKCPGLPVPTSEASSCPSENLVTGGCLESVNNLASWTLMTYTGAQGSYGDFDNCIHIVVDIPGTQHWNIQVTQPGIQMLYGQSYTLSFDAHTNVVGRKLTVNIGEGEVPYGSYCGEYDADLNCEWQHFEFSFVPNLPDNPNARFEINAGKYEGDVFIDNIILLQN